MSNRLSPQGGTLLGIRASTIEGFSNTYSTAIRDNPIRLGFGDKTVLDPSITVNGAVSSPRSYDYASDKSGPPEVVFIEQITRNGPFGIPLAVQEALGVDVIDGRDTVFSIQTGTRLASRSTVGDRTTDVTDDKDNLVATGVTGGTTAFENAWFNDTWFSDLWFNSTWFNTIVVYTGNANITEDGDDVTSSARVEMSATANITEDNDWTTTYGSSGNDVTGEATLLEGRDTVSSTARTIVTATATVLEGRDTVSSTSSGDIVRVLLTWEIYGGMTQIDIYRSEDNVTFTKVNSVGGGITSYIDETTVLGKTYYYYLIGKQTTGEDTDSSDIESITTPN